MDRRHLLRLVLTAPLTPVSAVFGQERGAIRVFADLEHRGRLDATVPARPAASRFGIAVPLPPSLAAREVLPERAGALEIGQRLGRLRVEGADAADPLRLSLKGDDVSALSLYRKTDDGWRRLEPEQPGRWTVTAGTSRSLEIGVGVVLREAVAGSPDVMWRRAFTVEVGTNAASSHQVPFRVAPFILPTSLDPVEEVLIVDQPNTAAAVKALRAMMASTSVPLFALSKGEATDQWMQDAIEPGLFAFPGAKGVEQAHGVLTGLRKEFGANAAALDRQIAAELRERGTVTVAAGVPRSSRWIDWFGNLEVTPPHTDRRGRRFPYGRVVIGRQRELSMHPGVQRFLEAQAVQWPPIVLDTSWLFIGHVDEIVSFVPAKTTRGYKVLLPSPQAARTMLKGLLAKGLEKGVVFAGTRSETTVGALVERVAGSKENDAADQTILSIRDQLKAELDLADADFAMVPALFERGMAVIPNAVNSLVFDGHFVAPEPRGPKQDGRDLFEQAIRESLASCDVKVAFVDAWNAYHVMGGEIHCGSNTLRRLTDAAWWKHTT